MREQPEPTMPFGKHRGKTIDELPVGYLHWLVNDFVPRNGAQREIVKAAEVELGEREAWLETTRSGPEPWKTDR